MPNWLALPVVVLVSLGIVAGQALLQKGARDLAMPLGLVKTPIEMLASPTFWAAGFVYLLAIGAYLTLLRNFSLFKVNVLLISCMLVATAAADAYLSKPPGAIRVLGVGLLLVGAVLALQE